MCGVRDVLVECYNPSFYARLCCIAELCNAIQGAGPCKKGALQHVRGVFCRETAFACCVSIEVWPFLPLLLAACVTCT